MFPAEKIASAKALGQQCAWHLIKRRSMCLESGDSGQKVGRWGGETGMAGSLKACQSGWSAPTQRERSPEQRMDAIL